MVKCQSLSQTKLNHLNVHLNSFSLCYFLCYTTPRDTEQQNINKPAFRYRLTRVIVVNNQAELALSVGNCELAD